MKMRITNAMMSQNVKNNIETASERNLKLADEAATGEGVTKPSDDPAAIQRIIRLRNSISTIDQYKKNASAASSYMATLESTIGGINDQLQRARDLAEQLVNGTNTPADRASTATEVDQIAQQLSALANTQVTSKYVFSGTATDQPLVDGAGAINTAANSNKVEFLVSNNLSVDVSVDGKAMFGGTAGILTTLSDLSNALRSNATSGISASLSKIDANLATVSDLRTDLGARMNRISALQDQLNTTSTNLKESLSNLKDVPVESTLINYTSQQNVYKAALAVGAKIIQPSLVDYLR